MTDTITSSRKVDRIMYVCTDCHDAGEEICCYADRRDLGVMPDGRWLCENCLSKLPDRVTKGLECPPAYASAEHGIQDEGIEIALRELCKCLGVDPMSVIWDAATETVEGDVSAVIGNILCAKFGDDFDPKAIPAQPQGVPDNKQIAEGYSDWAWEKKGDPVGLMLPNEAARAGFFAGVAWMVAGSFRK